MNIRILLQLIRPRARFFPRSVVRAVVIIIGICGFQFALFGPSLVGKRVLLPLDLLQNVYTPSSSANTVLVDDFCRSDLVFQFEPERVYASREIYASRLPLWDPHQFAGVPTRVTVFSPFFLIKTLVPSPIIHAWLQLLLSLVAGCGLYLFCSRSLGLRFLPSAIVAWLYPLTGGLVLWQGFALAEVIGWFPWLLLTVDRAVSACTPSRVFALASVAALCLLTGALDVAGLAFLAAGSFGVWQAIVRWKNERGGLWKPFLALLLGWSCSFLIAAPYLLPMVDYLAVGSRMESRASGVEERPPVGLSALPQILVPEFHGTTKSNSHYLGKINMPESPATAYAGILAILLLAPVAWCGRRLWWFNVWAALLAISGVAWALDLAPFVEVCRLHGLNMFSFNRFAYVSAFVWLAQAGIGLDLLLKGEVRWRWWLGGPAVLAGVVAAVCIWRYFNLPDALIGEVTAVSQGSASNPSVISYDHAVDVICSFRSTYAIGALLAMVVTIAWFCIWGRRFTQPVLAIVAAGFLSLELFLFAFGKSGQFDMSLYYPGNNLIREVKNAGPGRVVGAHAFPANLAQFHGLDDIRGYDAIDPSRYVRLVSLAAAAGAPRVPYAALQFFSPKVEIDQAGALTLSPILDLLGVRYVIFRGPVPHGVAPMFSCPDYFVLENERALPRAFVPVAVQVEKQEGIRLEKMGAPSFDPRALAFVETNVALPSACSGAASVRFSTPVRVVLDLQMATDGLVVLTDRWHEGWRAYLDGEEVSILLADQAFRGVVVSRNSKVLEFRYEPKSFRIGVVLALAALLTLGVWAIFMSAFCRRPRGEMR